MLFPQLMNALLGLSPSFLSKPDVPTPGGAERQTLQLSTPHGGETLQRVFIKKPYGFLPHFGRNLRTPESTAFCLHLLLRSPLLKLDANETHRYPQALPLAPFT
jgi:hypothetical protein